MQYLSPSHQTQDLNCSYSFVDSSWSVFRNSLSLYSTCNFSSNFFFSFSRNEKAKTTFYTNMLKYDITEGGRNAVAWKGGCIFLSQSYGCFCPPLTQSKNGMFLQDFLREDCVPSTMFQLSKLNVLSGIC